MVEYLTCKHCEEILNEPVTLDCGHNVCKYHIDEQATSFKCPRCDFEFNPQNKKLRVNEDLKNLANKQLSEQNLDKANEDMLKNFRDKIEILQGMHHGQGQGSTDNRFSEMRNQIEIDKNELKNQIDILVEDIMKSLDSYEKGFKKYYSNLVVKGLSDLNKYERALKSSKSDGFKKQKCAEIKNNTDDLTKEIDNYENKAFDGQSITYLPMRNVMGKNIPFGRLRLVS